VRTTSLQSTPVGKRMIKTFSAQLRQRQFGAARSFLTIERLWDFTFDTLSYTSTQTSFDLSLSLHLPLD